MSICNFETRTKREWKSIQDKIWDYWIYDRNGNERLDLTSRFTDKHEGFNPQMAAKNLKWFIEQRLELPFNENSFNVFTKEHIKRIKVEIDAYANALGGKFSNLAYVVPELISKQDPTSRQFYTDLNNILNVERINVNKLSNRLATISDSMTEAYIHTNRISGLAQKLTSNKGIEKLRELRRELVENPENSNAMSEFVGRVEQFIKNDKDGRTIKEYIDLIHMKQSDFDNAGKAGFKDPNEFNFDGTKNENFGLETSYSPYVYKAVKQSRQILNEMGSVYLSGLGQLKQIIGLKFANTSNPVKASAISRTAKRAIERITELETNFRDSLKNKDEGYFPHIQFETIMSIKAKMDAMMNSPMNGREAATSALMEVINSINVNRIPDSIKRRGAELLTVWEKDPLLVIGEYGNQAINFNKNMFTARTYLESLKNLTNTGETFQKGVKRFIDEEFAVFTRGTSQRPDWANNAVMTLNALQTARTMGLNITGAIKNATSALHFFSRVGLSSLNKAVKAFNHDTDGIQKTILEAEKEAGFLFTDAAQELYTEGLISKSDLKSGAVKYDPYTGKMIKNNEPLKDYMIEKGQWVLDKALFFHRITENNQRKWMFRVAFNEKYQYLINAGTNSGKAKDFAKNHALQTVNGWAYEYAAHAKSKWARGEWRTVEEMADGSTINKKLKPAAGMISELSLHLMHYPMSLFESQYSTIKGAHKAILAGQGFNAPEIRHLMNYAGIATVISLVSILTNTNLFNLFEHDTIERTQRIFDDLNEFDNPDRGTFGLLSEFTGTNLGTLKYLAIAGGLIDVENNDLNKILFGNVDFSDESDRYHDLYNAYQYSTFWGQWSNKYYPAIRDGRGRDLITHTLKAYPTENTKYYHDLLFKKKKKKEGQSKRGINPDVLASLDLLAGVRR